MAKTITVTLYGEAEEHFNRITPNSSIDPDSEKINWFINEVTILRNGNYTQLHGYSYLSYHLK